MVALNFSPQFAGDVERRIKTCSIRLTRRANVGDRLQLFTGQRTKDCRKLTAEDPVCVRVEHVAIRPHSLTIGDRTQTPEERDVFAKQDGFANYAAMHAWFSDRYSRRTFIGWLHVWHWPDETIPAADDATCFICAQPLLADDVCAIDISEGICHAACIEGAPVVDLETGEEVDGPIDTFRYGDTAPKSKGSDHG